MRLRIKQLPAKILSLARTVAKWCWKMLKSLAESIAVLILFVVLSPFILIEELKLTEKYRQLVNSLKTSIARHRFLKSCYAKAMGPTSHANIPPALLAAFRSMLTKDGVNLVAVSGRFGAGKSSFLRTYFRRRWFQLRRPKVLWISFARFSGQHSEPLRGRSLIEALEVSVLQQVFFSFAPNRFPSSRFSRIAPVSLWQFLRFAIVVLLTIGALGILLNWTPFEALSTKLLSFFTEHGINIARCYISNGCYLWVALASVFCLNFLYRTYRKGRLLLKYEFKGAQLALQPPTSDSVLNSFLDELIYYLSESGCKYVVFEDIDRFNDVGAFVRLRELNCLVNSSQQYMGRRKAIKFIFSISDEMFPDPKERTKFFDYILPVVPYLSSASSLFSFREILGKGLHEKALSGRVESLLRLSSLYISDQRVVISICNEFFAYRRALSLIEEHHVAPLLALMILKNFEPALFSELYTNNNFITRISRLKQDLLAECEENKSSELGNPHVSKSTSTIQALINRGLLKKADIAKACQPRGRGPLPIDDQAFIFSLLEGGFVNERYAGYLTNFKDGGLSLGDRNFEMAVRRGEKVDAKAKLRDVHAVISDLPEYYFRDINIFNEAIFVHLLQHQDETSEETLKLRSLCEAMSLQPNEAIPRLIPCLCRGVVKDVSLNRLKGIITSLWPKFIADVAQSEIREDTKQRFYELWSEGVTDKKKWLENNVCVVASIAGMRIPETALTGLCVEFDDLLCLMIKHKMRFSKLSKVVPLSRENAEKVISKDAYEINLRCLESLQRSFTGSISGEFDIKSFSSWLNAEGPECFKQSLRRRQVEYDVLLKLVANGES